MSNHGFGLLNIISSIINEERDGNDVAIARYLISNLRNSEAINVSAITERAHVTRSAVRRFCNRLGYQSLSELKNSFSQLVFPSDFRHRDPNLSFNEYRAELDIRMMEMYAEVESRISDALLDELAYEIAQHRNVELLCTNNVSGNLMRFQQEMFFAGKIVRLNTQDNGKPPMRVETYHDSLVIVVSVSGMFARELDERMWGRTAKKVLITAFSSKDTASRFDKAYYLSGRGDGIDELGVYSKYAITYLFDLLSSRYITKYKTPGNPLFGPTVSWPEIIEQKSPASRYTPSSKGAPRVEHNPGRA
ncbi:MurR/RpiR family transcriptional regulator [Collinsella sp. AF08-23]|uniref:MurR/RpiR family transcriptional regulator n=1 Tax=Collinsella sp. AF08-23 TaxID=2292211 RepID=UPI001314620D|nr:hypothetical protein [Collinsella sp. AF08-23]